MGVFTPITSQLRPAPTPANPLEQAGQVLQLKDLLARQALIPGQLQQQQQGLQLQQEQIKGAQTENQLKTIDLQNVQKAGEYWANPDKFSSSAPNVNGGAESMFGIGSDDPIAKQMNGLIRAGVSPTVGPNSVMSQGKALVDFRDNYLKGEQTKQAVTKEGLAQMSKLLTPIAAETDPAKQAQMLQDASPQLSSASQFDPSLHAAIMGADVAHLPAIVNHIGGLLDITNYKKAQSEQQAAAIGVGKAQSEATSADPVFKLSQPDELAKPGAQASIQALIDSPQTKPEDVPRLQALLPKAAVAQQNVITQKNREQAAQQAISQGDPDVAGKLLAARTLTLDELKLRSATPQFISKAVMAAQKYDPTFKAPEAAAQAAIAKAPQNQMFFGNTDSLLIKGGTLDQLSQAGKNLGNTQLPAWNSVDNLVKASLGKGPVAAYAAAVLNVADDQAKVMGGSGAATDTSRGQSLSLYGRNMSPEAREASINQVRQGVLSQRRGRQGLNPYTKDMYPEPEGADRGTAANAATGFKVGQPVTIKGKQMTVTAIHPDGSFDAK